VRKSAEDRVFGKMQNLLKLKEKNPRLIVAVTGCMPGRDKTSAFKKKLKAVDLYFSTAEMVNLPRWITELRPDIVNSGDLMTDYLKIKPGRIPSSQAYVTIQTGCNNFCAYCVVPHSRGLEQNRPLKDILEEVKDLAERGVIEITLLGQVVNAYKARDSENFSAANPYVISSVAERSRLKEISPLAPLGRNDKRAGDDKGDHFAALLWEINQIPNLQRVHWTAPHPNHMTDEVIDALTLPKQINFLHLPVQSGSNEVLRRMNRKYTREKFLEIIQKIKAQRPGMALGTDIIVGFSGETPEQFEETVTLFKIADFDISYHAEYSVRSGTLAAKIYQDDVAPDEKKRRWRVLQKLLEETSLRKNQVLVGQPASVLVTKVEQGIASGNTNEMKLCSFRSDDPGLVGKIVRVKIIFAGEWQLIANLLE
jgi:tRNA-2-methylthio-N6-dimethylallyladenosine synthase